MQCQFERVFASYKLVLYSILCSHIICRLISNQDFELYAGTVKHHSVCKRHVSIDTGFKQTERTIFLHVVSMG